MYIYTDELIKDKQQETAASVAIQYHSLHAKRNQRRTKGHEHSALTLLP